MTGQVRDCLELAHAKIPSCFRDPIDLRAETRGKTSDAGFGKVVGVIRQEWFRMAAAIVGLSRMAAFRQAVPTGWLPPKRLGCRKGHPCAIRAAVGIGGCRLPRGAADTKPRQVHRM